MSIARFLTATALFWATVEAQPASPATRYSADIRRTSYGVAHITARDFGGLGFGEGYAQAEDHLCSIADQVVKARGERAKYFGAGKNNEHLANDITMKAFGMGDRGAAYLAKQPREIQEWFAGFAAGYNKFLAQTPKEKYPGWCRGTDWVHPITPQDMAAYQQVVLLVTTAYAPMIASAAPPAASSEAPTQDFAAIEFPQLDLASNGWAIGKDLAESKRGMLIANPHYPWVGSNRFWEKHLTIPGKLNVYGVGLIGNIGVSIGFNKDVAWTHTVSAGKRFTVYSLDLAPGKPNVYRYGNSEREMTRREVSVQVKQADGSLKAVQRTVWFSHYGPVLNIPGLGWTAKRVFTVRDANWDNMGAAAQWLDMGRAQNMREFQAAHEKHQGMPWVNTIASSRDGVAWYADTASTPNLSKEALGLWRERLKTDPVVKRLDQQNMVLLDGSDPRNEWQADAASTKPGIVGYAGTPHIERSDYVFNANDSFWIANSHAPLTGAFSPLHGEQNTVRSLRTRNNDLTLSNISPDKPAGSNGKFNLDEMASALLSNRSLAAELFKDELVNRCRKASEGLGDACNVLASWNGRYDLDSRGAVLFREFLAQFQQADFLGKGKLYAIDFDPQNPTNTPRGLAEGDLAIDNLRKAVEVLKKRNIALDVPLGELQYADKAGRRMPVHGGDGFIDGLMNMQRNSRNTTTLEPVDEPKAVTRTLTEKGYPVVHGSSFVMALEFTDKGPRAKAFLTYSQSGDPASPHFTDQTELFAKKAWRPVLFEESAVKKDVQRKYKVASF